MTMADKIVVIRDGRVEQVGSPLNVYDRPDNIFVAGFIGSPSMNFLHGKIVIEAGRKIFVSESGLCLPLPDNHADEGQSVTYGIRPEHVSLSNEGVEVEVVVVEPTGSETQIFTRSGTDMIDALVKDRINARPGSQLHLRMDPSKIHLFDRKTGERV